VKRTRDEFVELAKKVHGDKYDYSLVDYKNNKNSIQIICHKHGIFEQRSGSHLKYGCKKCSNESQLINISNFIKIANEKHNNKFNYSLVKYNGANTKIKIICPIHGEFEQLARKHLKGEGCMYCGGTNKKTTEEFINQSIKINEDKYDYSLCEYKGDKIKIKLICKEHNKTIEVSPYSHLRSKYSCPICNNRNHRLSKIKRAIENKTNNYPLAPFFNPIACNLFNDISKEQNIHIQHAMNGGEYYIKELGYWLDGYDKINNTVYEYDERHHFIKGQLREKDIIRQKEIENNLNCKFIRIKYS